MRQNISGIRTCIRCKQPQPVGEFYKRADSPSRFHRICKTCKSKYHKEWYKDTVKERRLYSQRWNIRIKMEVFKHYSGGVPHCTVCNEPDPLVLCLDHINGNGAAERRRLRLVGGTHFYLWLRNNGYPGGYQVLCANCNMRKETIRLVDLYKEV